MDEAEQASDQWRATSIQVASAYSALPEVHSVVLSGSDATRVADAASDIDIYVYFDGVPSVASRVAFAQARASAYEVDNRFWEVGDEWLETGTSMQVDVTFRTAPGSRSASSGCWSVSSLGWVFDVHMAQRARLRAAL